MKLPLCQIDLAQTISEWKDVQSNKEDDQYLGDICFSLRYGTVHALILLTITNRVYKQGSQQNTLYLQQRFLPFLGEK